MSPHACMLCFRDQKQRDIIPRHWTASKAIPRNIGRVKVWMSLNVFSLRVLGLNKWHCNNDAKVLAALLLLGFRVTVLMRSLVGVCNVMGHRIVIYWAPTLQSSVPDIWNKPGRPTTFWWFSCRFRHLKEDLLNLGIWPFHPPVDLH